MKLPIGIQSFEKLISGAYTYVDKTHYIAELVKSGMVYFLSRPRRFGKSLFVDTMDCAFSGRRELFKGLYLDTPESGWDWSKTNPVLRVDWSMSPVRTPEELHQRIDELLTDWQKTWNIQVTEKSVGGRTTSLVKEIHRTTGRTVVFLVDEYDKPILDTLEDPETAKAMRDILKDFYSALKPIDAHLRFIFLTGVSKFSKTGIFSGLNNPEDITLTRNCSAICGYTQDELERDFKDYLASFDKDQVREWYNGYRWTGEAVYNPFDILLLFKHGEFRAHWFETGTPTFLVKLWKGTPRNPAEYDGLVAGEDLIGSFEIDNLSPITLLFQSGYLTIRSHISNSDIGTRYTLAYPNREVRQALSRLLLLELVSEKEHSLSRTDQVRQALTEGNVDSLKGHLVSFLSSIPYDWFRKNPISKYEGYWASVIYTLMAGTGLVVIPEDTTNKGRIDLTVKTKQGIWIFEFKVKGMDKRGCESPLAQLREKGYAQKYAGSIGADGKALLIREIGIVFDAAARNFEQWEVGE